MPQWYAIHSFVTIPPPAGTDLSAFFLTTGIADIQRQNSQWRLIETHYNPDYPGTLWYSGNVDAEGTLDAGDWPTSSPPDFIFTDPDYYFCGPGYMELQVNYNQQPQCPSPSPPFPNNGSNPGTGDPAPGGCCGAQDGGDSGGTFS